VALDGFEAAFRIGRSYTNTTVQITPREELRGLLGQLDRTLAGVGMKIECGEDGGNESL